eukprot:m51a1_g3303 putative arginine deiminase (421) ;mRNA; f:315782-317272
MSAEKSQNLPFNQIGETYPAWFVLTHRPSLEIFAGSVHPAASLFETGISLKGADDAHQAFVQAIKDAGVHVVRVEEALQMATRERLIAIAAGALEYEFHGNPSKLDPERDLPLFTDEYKMSALEAKSSDELASIILTRPLVLLQKQSRGDILYIEGVQLRPLANLVFVRDQQIVTARGLVIGNLNTPQRRAEAEVMEIVFELLGIKAVAHMTGEDKLEGGDFLPLSKDLAFIGCGLRTNMGAINRLMKEDLLGTKRLAVVRDVTDRKQKRMHLDTVFNIVDEHTVLMWEKIVSDPRRRARLVDLYERETEESGEYKLVRHDVPLPQFCEEEGFRIVMASDREQDEYMINFVNLGRLGGPNSPAHIISVHPHLRETLEHAGVENVTVEYVNYRGITRMYGAAHCTTQVFRRGFNDPVPKVF